MATLQSSEDWPPGKNFNFEAFVNSCLEIDREVVLPNGQLEWWRWSDGRVIFGRRIGDKIERTNAAGEVIG